MVKYTFPELKLQTPNILSTRLTSNLDSPWMNSFNLPSLPKFGDTLPSSIKESWSYKSWKLKNNVDNVMKDWDNSMKDMNKQWENPTLMNFSGKTQQQDQGVQQQQQQQQQQPSFSDQMSAAGINAVGSQLSGLAADGMFGDSEFGRGMGTIFSQGVTSATDTMANNIIKGTSLTQGLGKNVGSSVAGAGAGLAANYIGKGITSALGDSKLARGIGQGVATGLGAVGGQALGNLIKTGTASNSLTSSIKAIKAYKGVKDAFQAGKATNEALGAAKAAKLAGVANLAGLGMTVAGTALGAAIGPSKEYGGKYGNITQIADTAYDAITAGVNFIPGAGQVISGALALNKGLSNLFGSTDGMTVQDAILGSAFMPAPVKWLNMWGANTTSTFNNQSWQNSEKTKSFMGNAFGNLQDKFDSAREEAGKTYGLFSQGAYRDAQKNINFANRAWDQVLAMADQNELQNIRSQAMSSINNQRYAQDIQGGWSPLARGKYGMKILNNATNHNIGMRLLSGAALIDNKQMILCSVVD